VTTATADDLLRYLADLVERLERYALTLLPPDDGDEIKLGREPDGDLVIDLETRLPAPPRAGDVELDLFERWSPAGREQWARVDYRYELRHHALGYRRAFHRHDTADFVRLYDVATHEHCESTIGLATCEPYAGDPIFDAFDGFERLYGLWLTDRRPDCSTLRCLR
jgi:hypothetical protein